MGERLNRNDWGWIVAAIIVAALSLFIVERYFHRAFPQASINFQVSGPGSESVAAAFLRARGLHTAGFLHAEAFDYDDNALTFLERSLGLPVTETLIRTRLPLWHWQNRWFKPLTKEEFQVAVATSGQVVGFDHQIADADAGANLSEEQARVVAELFLTEVMHQPWAEWTDLGAERQARPHRTDYVFTWRDRDLISGAELRHELRVQGDQIGAYRSYLRVPDAWQRDYNHLRSKNDAAGEVDSELLLVLAIGMLVILLMRIRRNDIRWRTALWIGGVGAVLSFLADLNSLGADKFDYVTTQSWSAFLSSQLLGYLASAVGIGVLLLLLTAAAESLYRERFPGKVSVSGFLSWRGVRSKAFFLSVVLGLALAALFFAYQTVFYLIANHFGAWAPADIPYDDLLNTKLPWAFVLFSGFFPAISEEFGFRMLAIPLFEKWFRYLWVAVIAASFLWGFGHATYPNEPFYIRGVEVGLGGILLSWVMIRFGILTTVVWHYTVDALYTALLLLRAHNAYMAWSGAITALLALAPLAVALIAYWVKHGFVPAAPLTNAAEGSLAHAAQEPAPHASGAPDAVAALAASPRQPAVAAAPALSAEPPRARYVPISGQDWTTGLIVSAALLSAFAVPTLRWATVLPWKSSRAQAIAIARQFVRGQGYDPAGYRAVASQSTALADPEHGEDNRVAAAASYTQRGRRALLAMFSGSAPTVTVPAETWQVRLYRFQQPEEFSVTLRPDTGAVVGFDHAELDSAPGASPPLAQAQATAASFLAAQGISVAAMSLQTAQQLHRPARTDTTLIWADHSNSHPGGAEYWVEADLQGSQLSHFNAWYHVPEAAVRDYERGTFGATLLRVAKGLMYAAATALVLGLLFVFARRRALSWVAVLKLAIAAGIVSLAISANAINAAWLQYPTEVPGALFRLSLLMAVLVAGLGGFLLTLALTAPLAITAPIAAALTRANARRQLERETAWDALWVGLLALAWSLGWSRVVTVVSARWHAGGLAIWPSPPGGLTQIVPGLGDILAVPLHALWIAAALGILLPMLLRAWRQPKQRRWCVLGVGLLWIGMFPAVRNGAQFGQAAVFSGLALLLLLSFGYLFLRDSPLAYLSAAIMPALVAPGAGWLLVDAAPAPWIGGILLALAGLWLIGLAWVSLPGRALANEQPR